MKKFHFLFLLMIIAGSAFGRHIKGGWVQYEYVSSPTATSSTYKITVYVFRSCPDTGPMPSSLGIFDAATNVSVQTIANTASSYQLIFTATKKDFDPCLNNPPTICYQVYQYTTTVTLPNNAAGYIVAAQDAFRITGIVNILNSSNTGMSFTANIPGVIQGTDYHVNSSPDFKFTDTAIICYGSKFNYQFSATDADNDSLSYTFGDALNGVSTLTSPPYNGVPYNVGYSGKNPLGANVTIDPATGMISGTAPVKTGEYVIAVYATEWRNGVPINITKKELQITVGNCTLSGAALKTEYINCDDYKISFQNESAASNITSYLWDFGDNTTSTQPTPVHVYADTGVYTIKLKVTNSGGCADSSSAPAKIFPGFKPSFSLTGSCYLSPFDFTDKTFAKYGKLTSWKWDFGDVSATDDSSNLQNPTFSFPSPGTYGVKLFVTSSKGCSGTFLDSVIANGKPSLFLPFADTLICSVDSLPLKVQTSASVIEWTPHYNMINPSSAQPVVFPKDTTVYKVVVKEKGCIDSASVQVNVLQFISVKFSGNQMLCATDTIVLQPVSDALSYLWTEKPVSNSLNSYTLKYPKAFPTQTTTYFVKANLGYCQDSSFMTIFVAPYPTVSVSADTIICFGTQAQLTGQTKSPNYHWTPTNGLSNPNSLTPIARPVNTTIYTLFVNDTSFCKKTVQTSITVTVNPQILIDAGKDTSVTIGQPLHFQTSPITTELNYSWYPSIGLDDPLIAQPTGTYSRTSPDSIVYTLSVTNALGCSATDNVKVKIYKMLPDILVPSAFTPNSDGRNDILKPILIGVTHLHYFNVYNRWGQLIFTTKTTNQGWDGKLKGLTQDTGTYVYSTSGVDYAGNTIVRKGVFVLIR